MMGLCNVNLNNTYQVNISQYKLLLPTIGLDSVISNCWVTYLLVCDKLRHNIINFRQLNKHTIVRNIVGICWYNIGV